MTLKVLSSPNRSRIQCISVENKTSNYIYILFMGNQRMWEKVGVYSEFLCLRCLGKHLTAPWLPVKFPFHRFWDDVTK